MSERSEPGEVPPGDEACTPCDPADAFEFKHSFPMYVMKMSTFLKLKTMRTHEDMLKDGLVFEWTKEMGKVFFLSHQWTSFSHPDPLGEQLKIAQKMLTTMREGKVRSIFATEEEWSAFHTKESNRFMNFPTVGEEQLASEVKEGYVWLDFSSVPQAKEAEEARLRAIDSIPFYVDHSLLFIALVPRVAHKDLPGVFCDYKSWTERGWCRLELQVHELRLMETIAGEIMPGIPAVDIPRRPLIVHTANYATTYDIFDNFYMLWQRKNTVFTGEFACCRLDHQRTAADGSVISLPCDKKRIRSLIDGLWDRKIEHVKAMHPVLRFFFLFRFATHKQLMMTDDASDTGAADDPACTSLEDFVDKYALDQTYFHVFQQMLQSFPGMFSAHPSFKAPAPDHEKFWADAQAWFAAWQLCFEGDDAKRKVDLAISIGYAVAEGNATMLQKLHEEDGAPLHLGFMWGITLLDFAAGKGHLRCIKYLLEHGAADLINKPSFRDRITATDRACKAGFVDALELLHANGADIECRRLNLQVPAHGAAMWGHTPVLQRLHELGADVLTAVDEFGKAPLDYATYFCQAEATAFLRGLGGKGYLTEYERRSQASTKVQAVQRGRYTRRNSREVESVTIASALSAAPAAISGAPAA